MSRTRVTFEQRAAWMRSRQAASSSPDGVTTLSAPPLADCYGEHLTPAYIASILKLSEDKVRDIFREEPGVVAIPGPGVSNTRRYETLRIPRAVFERVYRRLTKI